MVKLVNLLLEKFDSKAQMRYLYATDKIAAKKKGSKMSKKDYKELPNRVVTENPNLNALKVAGLYDQEGMVREDNLTEKIAGYHTLQEDGVGNVNGHSISLEIEETPEGLQRGLMHRKDFPSGKGMLLKFGKKEPANIWMKNVNFPLDIVYIEDDKVIDVFKNALPDTGDGLFDSINKVICDMVLELPAGDSDKYNIGIGDMFGFNDLRGITEANRVNEVDPLLNISLSDPSPLPTTNAFTTAKPTFTKERDLSPIQDIGNNISKNVDFLSKPHNIYNKGGLNIKGQINAPNVGASWDSDNTLTKYGGPKVDIKNSANLSANYKIPGKNRGNLSAKVNYGTGNAPQYRIGYSLNI